MVKMIRHPDEYEAALARVAELAAADPQDGRRAEELELLSLLIEDYEKKQIVIDPPSPIEAIRFRMEQMGLTQRDLIPYLGSKSKVSEVLSGARPLTMSMARALHEGLGIPAESLLKSSQESEIDWERFPALEMAKRGLITLREKAQRVQAVKEFFAQTGIPQLALLHRTVIVREGREMDRYALATWAAQVMQRASLKKPDEAYTAHSLSEESMGRLARLSVEEDGPIRAITFLSKLGIVLVVEPHFARTSLDGAAMLLEDGTPVVALTLRHDRIDNFWYVLFHELAHIKLHLTGPDRLSLEFFDDLEVAVSENARETEADQQAAEWLIPSADWRSSAVSKVRAVPAVLSLATKLGIHPAIVAGRVRYEHKDFRVFSNLVGQGEVQSQFPAEFKHTQEKGK